MIKPLMNFELIANISSLLCVYPSSSVKTQFILKKNLHDNFLIWTRCCQNNRPITSRTIVWSPYSERLLLAFPLICTFLRISWVSSKIWKFDKTVAQFALVGEKLYTHAKGVMTPSSLLCDCMN